MILHICDLCKCEIPESNASITIVFRPARPAGMPPSPFAYVAPSEPTMEICEECAEKRDLMKPDIDRRPNLAGALTNEELKDLLARHESGH
jgi:hypothetical protein